MNRALFHSKKCPALDDKLNRLGREVVAILKGVLGLGEGL